MDGSSAKGVSCSQSELFFGNSAEKYGKIRRWKIDYGSYIHSGEIRLTDSEMDWLREAAWTSRMSQAEFIRSRVFRSKVPEVPQELKELLHRLDYSISKVGNNINQIAKSANAAGYASAPMIRKTLTLQEELEETCQKMCNEIVEGIRHGRYETAPD